MREGFPCLSREKEIFFSLSLSSLFSFSSALYGCSWAWQQALSSGVASVRGAQRGQGCALEKDKCAVPSPLFWG